MEKYICNGCDLEFEEDELLSHTPGELLCMHCAEKAWERKFGQRSGR